MTMAACGTTAAQLQRSHSHGEPQKDLAAGRLMSALALEGAGRESGGWERAAAHAPPHPPATGAARAWCAQQADQARPCNNLSTTTASGPPDFGAAPPARASWPAVGYSSAAATLPRCFAFGGSASFHIGSTSSGGAGSSSSSSTTSIMSATTAAPSTRNRQRPRRLGSVASSTKRVRRAVQPSASPVVAAPIGTSSVRLFRSTQTQMGCTSPVDAENGMVCSSDANAPHTAAANNHNFADMMMCSTDMMCSADSLL